MKYYKAYQQLEKPFITWHLWANSFEELTQLGEDDNPLIVAEIDVPAAIFGVCPLKIVSGELVARDSAELELLEAEFLVIQSNNAYIQKAQTVNDGNFNYDGESFPMHQAAQLRYLAIEKQSPLGSVEVLKTNGAVYTLLEADYADFLNEYYKQLLALTT